MQSLFILQAGNLLDQGNSSAALLSLDPGEVMGLMKHGKDISSLTVSYPLKAFPRSHVTRFHDDLVIHPYFLSPFTKCSIAEKN